MGAKLHDACGAIPLRGEQGLSITALSYESKLCIGLNADADLVPDLGDIGDALLAALNELGQVERRPRKRRLRAVEATG